MKPIKDFPGYFVTEDGRVFSKRRNEHRFLKPSLDSYGYFVVSLYFGSVKKTKKVHRLVYQAYVGDLIDGLTINHKDTNKNNNHYSNLEQITSAENVKHSIRMGVKNIGREGKRVVCINTKTNEKMYFKSATKAAKFLGNKDNSSISKACRGELNTCYGYYWRYA